MLFGYPVAATGNNWLHECLCEAIKTIHAASDSESEYPEWPGVLPNEFRDGLQSRRGLRERLAAYDAAIRQLQQSERNAVLEALQAQNRIADLLSGDFECPLLGDLPATMRVPISELFGFAFELLTGLGVRDQLYKAIYLARADHVCPFCGTEYFDAPGGRREDLDHYLARKHYAFAAVNLRNLVPMGHKCNSRYKMANNLLRGVGGARRIAFDPYLHATLQVSLDGSEPFGGLTENIPRWDIQFSPDSPAVSTWDEVFSIRERYRRDHLDPDYSGWLRLFAKWVRAMSLPIDTDDGLVDALRRFEESWNEGGMQDRAFLKALVFRMLRQHCQAGDERLKEQLRDLAPSAMQE